MNLLTAVSLTILGLSASTLASQSKSVEQGSDGYPDTSAKDIRTDQWTRKEMEMWQETGRWRRDGRSGVEYDGDDRNYPRRGHWEDRRERKSRGGERRWSEKDSGNNGSRRPRDRSSGRDDRNGSNGRDGNGNNPPPYPPTNPNPPRVYPPQYPPTTAAPSYPDQPADRDTISSIVYPVPVITTLLPPLPIIIEPIRSRPVTMPSIIEPYPEVVESESYYGSSSAVSPTGSYGPTSSVYGPTSSVYGSSSSVYVPTTSMYSSVVIPMSKKQAIYPAAANSTTYASTMIVTEAEATVTAQVTGRYRAMSNAADNLAGSVSFTIVLISSIFLIALV